ncbi:RHS repeat domain-containing protein [Streptomyces virginiae]|uniref:RHS repeat domain-containing protein n=1 Tax=Streptomyces virginiae TaxID=1961 RepID=UPI00371E34BA
MPRAAGTPPTARTARAEDHPGPRCVRPASISHDSNCAATTGTCSVEGHLTSHSRPDGATQRWAYDGEGNCLTETDANSLVTATSTPTSTSRPVTGPRPRTPYRRGLHRP